MISKRFSCFCFSFNHKRKGFPQAVAYQIDKEIIGNQRSQGYQCRKRFATSKLIRNG